MPPGGYTAAALERLVARQLGRVPSISFEVSVNCEFGWPSVIRSSPIKASGEPNPNLYYLVCPWLRRELARLEDSGLIADIEMLLEKDEGLAANTRLAQQDHTEEFQAALRACGASVTGRPRLIAGVSYPLKLKCLHAQVAYFMVHTDYELGGIIHANVRQMWCNDSRCSVWMDEIIALDPGAAGDNQA